MEDEVSSTATIALSLGGSISLLQRLGIISENTIPGAGASATILISNDYNPNDPAWVQFLDQLIPDEIGVAVELSVQDGAGLGGHLALEGTMYPSLSPTEILTNDNISIQGMAYGAGGTIVVDENNNLTGAGALLGLGLGLEVAVSGPALGLTFNAEELEFNLIVDNTVYNLSVNPFAPNGTGDECFAAGTPIDMWPVGLALIPDADGVYDQAAVRTSIWTKPIEEVNDTDTVVTFDGYGNAVPGSVDKLFSNTTPEFIRLTLADDRDPITTTPGHRFLTETGDYMEIGHMLRLGGGTARVVDLDGSVIEATGELIVYSAETAHMFPEAQTKTIAMQGNTVLKEQVEAGWQTYNFEVREHHNYVAGGVRVHNDSVLSTLQEGDQLVALSDDLRDAIVLRDLDGDGAQDIVLLDGAPDLGGNTAITGTYRVIYGEAISIPFVGSFDLAEELLALVADSPTLASSPNAILALLDDIAPGVSFLSFFDEATGSFSGQTLSGISPIIDGNNNANTLNGTSNADEINGFGGDDTINARAGDDTISGGAGDDRLDGGSGNDTINGNSGFDTAIVSGGRTASSVSRDGNNTSFVATSDDDTDRLRNVERIQYDDGRIALDIHGGRDADEGRAGYVYRLYETVLDRAPDINGLTNWVDAYGANDNWTFDFMAGRFTGSAEFANKYAAFRAGAADTSDAYVRYLYDAAFDRTPDAGGLNSFVSLLNNGTSRAEVAGIIAGSQEMRNKVFNDVKDGIFLDSFPAGVSAFRLSGFAQTASLDDFGVQNSPILPGYSEGGPDLNSWFDLSPTQLIEQYGADYARSVEGTDSADRLSGSRKADLIVAGDGDDVVSGGRGHDYVIGGDGDDILRGNNGRDTLEGGSGDDVLHGGGGKDVFLFAFDFEEDHDTIQDFKTGKDQIQLDWQVFSDLTITDGDRGAVVTYNGGETITLRRVDADTLSADDFIFASQIESVDPFFSF